jgi:O-antigen biosynthesis protein
MYRRFNFYAFCRSLNQLTPLAARKSRHDFRRLNLVIPSINREHTFGGISTALQLYHGLVKELGANVLRRIIVTDYAPQKDDLTDFNGYAVVGWDDDSNATEQILPANFRAGRTMPVTAGDVYLTTQWITAYLAQRTAKAQAELFGKAQNRMGYLIQDFEPGFYPYSTDHVLCESTYRSSVPQIAVFNSSFLHNYFRAQEYSFEREYCFEPRLNSRLKERLVLSQQPAKKRQILIYGRPSTPRNAFPLLLEGLKLWAGPQWRDWQVVSAGEQHPDVQIGHGMVLRSVGKVSLDQYAALLHESAVGASLMISPHPSYPPLEMAHFDMLTVTNRFGSKDLATWHDNIISIDQCTPEAVAEALAGQCARFLQDPETGSRGISRAPGYLDNSPPFGFLPQLAQDLFP